MNPVLYVWIDDSVASRGQATGGVARKLDMAHSVRSYAVDHVDRRCSELSPALENACGFEPRDERIVAASARAV